MKTRITVILAALLFGITFGFADDRTDDALENDYSWGCNWVSFSWCN